MTKHFFLFPPAQSSRRQPGAWRARILALMLLAASMLPVAAQTLRPADFIVAVVNSEPITNNEVQSRLLRIEQQLSRQGNTPPRDQLARDVLERLIVERAQLQLARTLGVQPEEAAVDQAVATVARQNQLSLDELKRRLAADGMDYTRFRSELRDELTLVRLREREVDARVRVSEQDIDQFLREREVQAQSGPELLNIAQILVAVPEKATPDQVSALQAKAEQALARLRAGETFASVAKEMSDAPESASGGELGPRPADRLPTYLWMPSVTCQQAVWSVRCAVARVFMWSS